MKSIDEILNQPEIKSIGIAGHMRPDGDCIGSCMALYLYLKKNYPDKQTDVYLEESKPVFSYIDSMDEIKNSCDETKVYDLFVSLDGSSRDRMGVAGTCFDQAKQTVCIDHHISNPGFAQINHICPEVSSASEVLYTLLDESKLDRNIAVAVYTGIIHDTGVFQYSSTSPETMRIAAKLLEYKFDFSKIIDASFYAKTYIQNQIMGRVLTESLMLLDGKCVVGSINRKEMNFYGVDGKDLDGIVSQLRLTTGIEVAIFLYELEEQHFKVSMRSNGRVDVSKVAVYFGGGGHVRAAGCDLRGTVHDVINNLTEQLEEQLQKLNGSSL